MPFRLLVLTPALRSLTRLACALCVVFAGAAVGVPAIQQGSAQDVSVRAWTNALTVGDDDLVTYSIEVRGAPFGQVDTPQPPSTTGLALGRSAPSAGREATYEDGELQQTITFRWLYRPLQPGQARIGSTTVRIDGRAYETDPIEIEVEPQITRTQRAQTPRPLRDSPGARAQADTDLQGDVLVRTVLDKQDVFANEQLTIEYQLLFRDFVRPGSSRLVENWEAEGLWREELDVEMRPTPETVLHEGERFDMITLMRAALFPMRPGTHTISPLAIRTDIDFTHPVRSERRAPSDPLELQTDPLEITARPLPSGAPAGFDGAVGQFALTASMAPTTVEVGDAVELAVEVRGSGNLVLLDPPQLEVPSGVIGYEPETTTQIERTDTGVESTATYTYTFVVRQPGTVTLPPVTFSYFDPAAEAYETLEQALSPITVREPTQPTITQAPPPADRPEETTERAFPLWTALATLLAAIAGLWAWRRRQDDAAADSATAAELSPLARAEAAAAAGEVDACYRALDTAIREAIAARSQQPALGQSQQELATLLTREGVPNDTIHTITSLLQEVEDAQYAPPAERPQQMEQAVARARAVMTDLQA